jgi:D-alanyl-D-alanine carboxypeptidase
MSGNDRTGEWGTKLTKTSANLRGCGRVALGIVSVLTVTTITLLPAEAKRSGEGHHFRAHVVSHGRDYTPPYAAIVVDANSGNVLHSANADELRHPASLTKIMTLYLLFERIEAGKLRLDSQLPVSEHASDQAPTKLGLKPGQTIAVEDAIKGLVTKSANDAAVVVGEALGGTEAEFAEMMTKKAHSIGMSRTVYRNASGLPNDEQVTTARDQALLGRAIQERFPKEYRYFSTLTFTYHGESMRNHNMLLGHVDGVDGIKTGYTQASGFNLVTSVHRNNRHVVAVVLGGTSAGARDAKMRSLLETHIASASTQKTATAFAQSGATKSETASAGAKPEARPGKPGSTYSVASVPPASKLTAADNQPTATAAPSGPKAAAPAGEALHAKLEVADTIKPIQVKTIKVKLTQTQTAGLGSAITPVREEAAEAAEPPRASAPAPKAPAPAPKAVATIAAAPAPVAPAIAPSPATPTVVAPVAAPAPAPVIVAPAAPAPAPARSAPTAVAAAAPAPRAEPTAPAKTTAPKTFTVASALYKPAQAPAFPPALGAAPAAPVEAPAAPAPKVLAMAPTAVPVEPAPAPASKAPVSTAKIVAALAPAATPAAPAPVAAPAPATAAHVEPAPAPAPKAPISAAKIVAALAPPATPAAPAPVAAAPVEPAPAPAPKATVSAAKPVAALAPPPAPAAPAPVAAAPVEPAPAAKATVSAAKPVAALAPPPAPAAPAPVAAPAPIAAAPAAAPIAPMPARMTAPVAVAAVAPAPEAVAPEPKREAVHAAPVRTGWIIQVGAFDVEHDAQQRLTTAQAKIGRALDRADPFTEPVQKGDKTLYRARFAGFQQKDEADAICKQLKRNDIDCMTIKN